MPAHQRWSTYVGGIGDDQVLSVATDPFGHVYVAGRTTDGLLLGNDTTGNSGLTYQHNFGGGASDAFLAKIAPQGAVLWCTYFGGAGDDEAVQVVVNGMDEVYLIGNTTSSDSIATDSLSFQQGPGGGADLFVARFTGDGALVGATYFGGPADEMATGGTMDAYGRLVVCAYANGPCDLPGGLAPQQAWTADNDGLLLRLKGTEELLAATYIGGSGDDRLVQVAKGDSSGVVLLGNTTSTNGIATVGAMTGQLQGGRDAFLMKVDTSMAVHFGTYYGGDGDDEARSLAQHGGLLAIAGATWSDSLYTTPQSYQPGNAGGGDGFLAVLDNAFTLQWATFLGDTGANAIAAVAIDSLGGVYTAGISDGGFIVSPDTIADSTLVVPLLKEVVLKRFLAPDSLDWSVHVGGMGEDEAHAMAVMGFTTVYLGGRTSSTQYFTNNPHQIQFGGGTWDGFSMRMDQRVSTPCSGISTCTGGGGGSGGGDSDGSSGVNPPQPVYHVCRGDSILFVAYGGALGFDAEWMWYADTCGANSRFLTSGDTIVLYPDSSFTLYVRAEGLNHVTSCSYAIIVVHELPVPVALAPDTVCAGAPITVHGSGAETYAWLVGDSVLATGADATFNAPMTGGVMALVLAGTNGPACTVDVPVPVVVLPPPDVQWNITHVGCTGEPGMIAMELPNPSATDSANLTIAWIPPSLQGPTPTGLAEGLYIALVTDTSTGCSRTDTLHVLRPPVLDAAWQVEGVGCNGEPGSIQLVVPDSTVLDSALQITWAQNGLNGPQLTGLSAGSYMATLQDTLGCSRTDTLVITQPPLLNVAWHVQGTTCYDGGDGAILLMQPAPDSPDTAVFTFIWAQPGLTGHALTGLAPGPYIVTVADSTGCSRMDSLLVTAPPPLMDSVATTNAWCGMATGSALVHTISIAPGLQFNFGNGPDTDSFTGQLLPGGYTVNASDNAGCAQQIGFTIQAFGTISVSIDADTLIAVNDTTFLQCVMVPADSAASIQWSPSIGLAEPTAAGTACVVSDTTVYVVLVTSHAGCTASDSVVVVPLKLVPPSITPPCGDFFLPDHFSPNGDGINDVLCPLGGCITSLHWEVLDRWGGKLFSSESPELCWDGTHNGIPVPAGSYVLTLAVERSTGETIQRTGTITLRR
ncbi:MAG: gliding motility-associated C-terminal domain-containing protein [Flavobacteriales bacterium]|nr:gliding motility-associated C-terminal domain-containing protein [Flavobacteriales bacterium]MBP9078688.1 gliding motility-associated C-terminal domain-containing protein [Flavobacteriales bacterium]